MAHDDAEAHVARIDLGSFDALTLGLIAADLRDWRLRAERRRKALGYAGADADVLRFVDHLLWILRNETADRDLGATRGSGS